MILFCFLVFLACCAIVRYRYWPQRWRLLWCLFSAGFFLLAATDFWIDVRDHRSSFPGAFVVLAAALYCAVVSRRNISPLTHLDAVLAKLRERHARKLDDSRKPD